jgi:hypothetical protein
MVINYLMIINYYLFYYNYHDHILYDFNREFESTKMGAFEGAS